MRFSLIVNELDAVRITLCDLILEIARTVSILTQSIDLAFKASERGIIEANAFCSILDRYLRSTISEYNLPEGP